MNFSQRGVRVLWIYFAVIYYQDKITQYNCVNLTLSNSQLNQLKSAINNAAEVTLNFSSNVIGDANNDTNFPYKWPLTKAKVSRLCKAFENNSLANIKLSKIYLSKILQSGEFLGRLNGTLLRTSL